MNKLVKKGFTAILVVALVGLVMLILMVATFDIFDTPTREVITQQCDQKGLRRATVFSLSGNATANPSLHISITTCTDKAEETTGKLVFTADKPNLTSEDATIKWITSDTLRVEYANSLRIFKQETEVTYLDPIFNIKIIYSVKP